jgi:hypothetical protein
VTKEEALSDLVSDVLMALVVVERLWVEVSSRDAGDFGWKVLNGLLEGGGDVRDGGRVELCETG